ncbi:peptide MFS transporter [Porphyromonas pogonae]|uniref:peptide MFS transporter n=1 Tax=Porphyromonas pogonae TaxID=867595 RepID=UPI002E7790CA|nr:peptide MFS transporter [Porphyromonas pogonae]
MLNKHPKGLIVLALTNMGERFGYYTMLAILTLYMQAKFGLSSGFTSMIYGTFLALVYFLPIFGGLIADKALGYGKTIFIGVVIMFGGYLLLAMPTQNNPFGLSMMFLSLFFISAGTGLFKGNLQALVGKLYDSPQYSSNRDIAFSIFYMFINIGAFFAPSMANAINKSVLEKANFTYDANIPKDYVALNNKVVDENVFMDEYIKANPKFTQKDDKEKAQIIAKKKKKDGVLFPSDKESALFNLKAAGLYQLTISDKISDPAIRIEKKEYELLESRAVNDQAAKEAVKAKIASVPEEALTGFFTADGLQKSFAERFAAEYVNKSLSSSYSLSFGVACISLVLSILIFLLFRKTWKFADITVSRKRKGQAEAQQTNVPTMSKHEVKERMTALFLVFFVVIFFWMSFHQNGLCMTFFARDYTTSNITPQHYMMFSLLSLLPVIVFMYGIYITFMGLFGEKKNPRVGIVLMIVGLVALFAYYQIDIAKISEMIKITPQIFQQFNPFFIIILTPAVVGVFTYLGQKGKEPSAPRKIGIGMLIAALGFVVLLLASFGLPAPSTLQGTSDVLVSPNWLIGTYFVLTIAELFLSPMGLSFVSKVAPPQYSGLMQGGWLAATAIGNLLVGVMGTFWEQLPLVAFWGVLVICCVLSAVFIFSVMKRLELVTK